MDREELEKIKLLSDNVTEEIQKLQEEILNYKSGAESFQEATEAIRAISREQEKIVKKQGELIREIHKYIEMIEEVSGKIKEFPEIEKEVKREVWRAKAEIIEKIEEKKKFRIFRRG